MVDNRSTEVDGQSSVDEEADTMDTTALGVVKKQTPAPFLRLNSSC